jgi:hypothetical protein
MLEAANTGKPLSPSRISKGSEIIRAAPEAEGLRACLLAGDPTSSSK